MATAILNGNNLLAFEDSSRTGSQASSPASPTASLQLQQTHALPPTININGLSRSQNSSHPGTPTHGTAVLEAPPGMSFPEYLRNWSDSHVARWLTDIKCGHLASTFKDNDIRGDVLLELDQVTLREMGMHSVGDRLRIINAVKGLRQKCSSGNTTLTSIVNRPRGTDLTRNANSSGEHLYGHGRSASRAGSRRLPAPLHLAPNAGSADLPRLIRDGQDSARSIASARPLPYPSTGSSHGTPTSRSNLPPIPPPPRGQPPLPPGNRTPRTLHPPANPLTGRRTPTPTDPPPFTNQPPPPAPTLLSPNAQAPGGNYTYGLPADPRPVNNGGRTPVRSNSPANQLTGRSATLPQHSSHNRTASTPGATTPTPPNPTIKLPPRPSTGNTPHPYASSQNQFALSPIAESFMSRGGSSTTPPPVSATPYKVGNGPFARSNTPSHNAPSLDDLRRKLVKFTLPDEGKSTTINIADCAGGVEVLAKALKKFEKMGSLPDSEISEHIDTDEGGLSVDGWGVYLDWGQDNALGDPLTEAQLLSVCHAPPDDPTRSQGLLIGRIKRSKGHTPTSPLSINFGSSDERDPVSLLNAESPVDTPSTKAMKRASSISVLSGLGVPFPEQGSSPSAPSDRPMESASRVMPSKFLGRRPPSELITTHLAEYFPFTEKKVLERTRRQSMMRQSGVLPMGKRDSIISWNPPSQSRFSISAQASGSQQIRTPRTSLSSASVRSIVPPERLPPTLSEESTISDAPPRLSLSTGDGTAVDLLEVPEEDADPPKSARSLSAPLLPPVMFPSESLAESMNLSEPKLRPLSTVSSKRMSYISELRSKRDRSDTVSLMTVDEITAEVENRRLSKVLSREISSTDDWTKVDVESDVEKLSISDLAEEEEDEDSEGETEGETDLTDTVIGDEDAGKAITSTGGERTIKWIKGALIGAGSFGKVYLGLDVARGLLMAVKQVELPTGSASNEGRKKSMLSALEREIELLKDLQHENIVQYHSSCMDDDHLNIFLEYVPGGSVTSLLSNYGAFEEPLVRNWVRQILLGLSYLHSRDIIHRDIKGANMLVDNKGGIKISDFGISKKVEDSLVPGHRAHRPSLQGSVFWMAPEVVKQTAYTQKADIWSVGCLVVEMLTGEHPWAQLTQMQAIFKIGSSAKPAIPADISSEAENFLQLTFELNHEARPTAAELLKHPWIANIPPPLGH